MSLEMSPSPSASASVPPLINSELGTYPPDPLPLIREWAIMVSEGLTPLWASPLLSDTKRTFKRGDKGGEVNKQSPYK